MKERSFIACLGVRIRRLVGFDHMSTKLSSLTVLLRNVCIRGEKEARVVKRIKSGRYTLKLTKMSKEEAWVFVLMLRYGGETNSDQVGLWISECSRSSEGI